MMTMAESPMDKELGRESFCETYDVIVIGSGVSGLTAAACLAKANKRVLVLEQHYTAGGLTHTFSRRGYEWGVGVHYIGEVHKKQSILRKIFDYISNETLIWTKIPDPYDKIILDDCVYEFVSGRGPFQGKMNAYFPDDEDAIERYLNLLEEVSHAASYYFAPLALPNWLAHVCDYPLTRPFMEYSQRTTDVVLSEITANKKLIKVLTGQWGDYGLPPQESSFAMHALVAKHYLDGANYPVGGSKSIFKSIAPTIRAAGGEVVTRAPVAEILIEKGRARGVALENGIKIFSAHVISAIGAHATYKKLIKNHTKASSALAKKTYAILPSIAHLCLYIGLKIAAHTIGLVPTNLWYLNAETHDPILMRLELVLGTKIPVLFVTFPSVKDPLWDQYHSDKSTIEIIVPVPYAVFRQWSESNLHQRGSGYEVLKKQITEILLNFLEKQLPQVKGHIEHAELSTPLSTSHFLGSSYGEMYGLAHDTLRFGETKFRTNNGIKHLDLVGQDSVTCGIGGACLSGALSALRILGPIQGRDLTKILTGGSFTHADSAIVADDI